MDQTPIMRERLLAAPWTLQLTGAQLARVSRDTLVSRFDAGAVVCREGEPSQQWIGVLDGMVKADTVSAEGRGTTFVGVSTGGWLGEGALLKREPRPYEVISLRESWIALVPAETFNWLFETSLAFNHFLVHLMNARLGQFVAVIESHRIQTTTAQVAVCMAGLLNPRSRPSKWCKS
jgi:CRP/FNR family cyclic AMP-dependent transcriptional regulator